MPLTWVAKSPFWYMNDPYKMQNLVYEWVNFSKFEPKLVQIFKKWKKLVILFKIWPKIGRIGIWMGYFFLKNWYLYESTFKFRGSTSLPKPNLSTPLGSYPSKFWHKYSHSTQLNWILCTHFIGFPILGIECTALWDLEWMSVLWCTINRYGRIQIFRCRR